MSKLKNPDRSQIPKPQTTRTFNFPKFNKFKLENGLEVLFASHKKLPLISVEMLIKSGANYDKKGKEGIASLVTDLLPEGTNTRSSQQISQGFDNIGTHFNSHVSWNASYVEMTFVKKHLNESMVLFSDILFNPSFDTKEIERIRKKLIQSRMMIADSAGSIAQEKFNQLLFNSYRFELPIIGQSEQIKNFSSEDALEFYN